MRKSFKRIDITFIGYFQRSIDHEDYQESVRQREIDNQNIVDVLRKTFPQLSLENTIHVEVTIVTNNKIYISSLSERHQRQITAIDFTITIPRKQNFKPTKHTTKKFLRLISILYPFITRESISGSIEENLTSTFVALK